MRGPHRRILEEMAGPGAVVSGEGPPVVAPSSTEDVGRILERASREGWRVLPAGLATWLGTGATGEVDLVLSTRKLDGLTSYEPADLTFTAGAGIPMSHLRRATSGEGQWLPLDPPGSERGSLGALASLGTAGPLGHAYGAPRDHVLGLTLVTGDGRVLKWGGRVVKNVAGFDVTRLSVGSRGALGVITSVSARLFPLPDRDVTLLLSGYPEGESAHLARSLAAAPLPLAAVELVDPLPGLRDLPDLPRGGAVVVRILGSKARVEGVEAKLAHEIRALGRGEASAGPGGESKRLTDVRSRALHAGLGRWEEGAALVLRLALLPSRLPQLVARARGVMEELGEGRLSAHAGAGVVRLALGRVSGEEGERRDGETGRWAGVLGRLRQELEEEGGSLVLSSGPRALVREVGAWGARPGEGRLLEGLKRTFDPEGVLAPGLSGSGEGGRG